MLEQGEELMVGVTILMKPSAWRRPQIGIENNKPDAIALLRGVVEALRGRRGYPW